MLQKITALEIENRCNVEKLEKELHDKTEEMDTLMKERENHKKHADMHAVESDQLRTILKEKEELILLSKEREKKLEDENKEVFINYTVAIVDFHEKLSRLAFE